MSPDAPAHPRRNRLALAAAAALAFFLPLVWVGLLSEGGGPRAEARSSPASAPAPNAETVRAPARKPEAGDDGRPSDRTRLRLRAVIGGDISPKSVSSSGHGLVTAQNMMYRHSVTVYDARTLKLVRTIRDAVRLSALGHRGFEGIARGAPVEADFSPDGRYAYVSNYSMYGAGFGPEGGDRCSPSSGYDRSFVYRVDMTKLRIDRAFRVGAVPKVVKATPDGRFVLVANWCTWDLSVVSTRLGREVRRIPIGAYPRGIAVAPGGKAAYVAVMGGSELVRVDLERWTTSRIGVGVGPRAVELHPSGRWAYVTLNAEGRVAKLDLRTGAVTAKVSTGSAPRSLAVAADGRALYLVNYGSGTVSKLRTADMSLVETVDACHHPIGIAYDRAWKRVWVACYTGTIRVYDDA